MKNLLATVIVLITVENSLNKIVKSRKNDENDEKVDIYLGGLFDQSTSEQTLVFEYTTDSINNNRHILPNFHLQTLIEQFPTNDEYRISEIVCDYLAVGVLAIFGPSTTWISNYVTSICEDKEIPNILTTRHIQPTRGQSVNFHPYLPQIQHVFIEIIKEWQWRSFTIVYYHAEDLSTFDLIVKHYTSKGYRIPLRQLDTSYAFDQRPLLKSIKQSDERNVVLACPIDVLRRILKQSQQVGIVNDQFRYLILSLDMATVELEDFQYAGANIIGVRVIDPRDSFVIDTTERWRALEWRKGRDLARDLDPERLRVDTALIYDAMFSLALALDEFNLTVDMDAGLRCDQSDNWAWGTTVINYIKSVSHQGLTGVVKFDNQGYRSDFDLDIIELTDLGVVKIGTWNATDGLKVQRSEFVQDVVTRSNLPLSNMSFTILISLTAPYGMLKDSPIMLTGNDQYEGYCVDLIIELAKILGFKYTFKVENNYGSLDPQTKQWNGMMREIMDGRADLALTDLTITSQRQEVVDFTTPFMNLGISLLYKKPTKADPHVLSFMAPFSKFVWINLGITYVGVSFLMFLLARISPREWTNPYPCVDEPNVLLNQFSFRNALWFVTGSILQQGCDLAPIAMSTRLVAGSWYFFTLIMVSSYTANLAAFLVAETTISPIRTAEDLPKQSVIEYGCKPNGSTADFFRDSTHETYQKIWRYMNANPHVFSSNEEGPKRVANSEYAFFMESTTIEYLTERNCDLQQFGNLLDEKGYGIAMKKNSKIRKLLSTTILELQETGKLGQMKDYWWKDKSGGVACSAKPESEAVELGMPNVGGVFLVTFVLVLVSFVMVWIQMILYLTSRSRRKHTSFWLEFKKEMVFLVQFKPTRRVDST